jgi:excisionase family DNA binding protein
LRSTGPSGAGSITLVAERLVSTGDAAKELGVSRQTLSRWVLEGRVTPAARTAGGQYRFRISELKKQLDWRPAAEDDE